MDFKWFDLPRLLTKPVLWVVVPGFLLVGGLLWRSGHQADAVGIQEPAPLNEDKETPAMVPTVGPLKTYQPLVEISQEDKEAIGEQLEHNRQQQRHTEDLKITLEQTNLELAQQKALAEMNKLKKENMSSFDEPTVSRQNDWPEIKVDYIGGDRKEKEAILSIGGSSYQVKEKTSPVAGIEVESIYDSTVSIHLNGPHGLTKTFDFKPE